jgi:ribonuclease D
VATQERYIDTAELLREYLDEIAGERLLALDTEFVREKTYYPQLCLVQIASVNRITVVDCVADIDLAPLFDRLLRDDCVWILHSGRQDLEVVYQHASRLPAGLIDTQIAAGLVGYPPQIGLQDLLADILDVHLDKDLSRTDWSRRPLPPAALEYARDDVRSLHALWAELEGRLERLGRREWLEEDCALLLRQPPVAAPGQIWARLKGLRALDAEGRCAALALVEWREERARSRNRPRRWILSDERLLALARARPTSLTALAAAADLPPKLIHHSGRDILESLEAASLPANRERIERTGAIERPDREQLLALQARMKTRAAELGIHPELLATKQELVELLSGVEPPRIAASWRAAELRTLLSDAQGR